MSRIDRSRFSVRFADTEADLHAAQRLRHRVFRGGADGLDADCYDARCRHVLVQRRMDGELVCCFRLMVLPGGHSINQSYSSQFYELSRLQAYDRPMLELGRFCVSPDMRDPDILRVAFGSLGQVVDREGTALLFGCTSFEGTESARYADAFALLRARHLAPARWLPQAKAPAIVRFADLCRDETPDAKAALSVMPPLLRSYLAIGGWVSDHAVIDRDLDTLHVFTAVEIAAIPPARARVLRGLGV